MRRERSFGEPAAPYKLNQAEAEAVYGKRVKIQGREGPARPEVVWNLKEERYKIEQRWADWSKVYQARLKAAEEKAKSQQPEPEENEASGVFKREGILAAV